MKKKWWWSRKKKDKIIEEGIARVKSQIKETRVIEQDNRESREDLWVDPTTYKIYYLKLKNVQWQHKHINSPLDVSTITFKSDRVPNGYEWRFISKPRTMLSPQIFGYLVDDSNNMLAGNIVAQHLNADESRRNLIYKGQIEDILFKGNYVNIGEKMFYNSSESKTAKPGDFIAVAIQSEQEICHEKSWLIMWYLELMESVMEEEL